MKEYNGKIIFHLVGFLCFLFFPVLFVFDFFIEGDILNGPHIRPLVNGLLILSFYYINYYYFVPRYFLTKKRSGYVAFILLSFVLIESLEYVFLGFGNHDHHEHRAHHRHSLDGFSLLLFLDQNLILFALGCVFPLLFRVNDRWKQDEKAKIDNELSHLKAQIKPHFLFNTLNSIYSLSIIERAERTGDGLLKLSGMMRYVLTDSYLDFVLLDKEIKYIRDFFELQRLRTDNLIELVLKIEGEAKQKKIAPMILIPFVENAFKFGVNPEMACRISIELYINDHELSFNVFNLKASKGDRIGDNTGLGIINTRHRLELIYPGNFELSIKETDNDFLVKLNLKLNS